jgi:hypothetical protein
VAKCANCYSISHTEDKLLPNQLGVNTPGGSEAVVHATRQLILKATVDDVVVTFGFINAFNFLHRDVTLQTVTDSTVLIHNLQSCLWYWNKATFW